MPQANTDDALIGTVFSLPLPDRPKLHIPTNSSRHSSQPEQWPSTHTERDRNTCNMLPLVPGYYYSMMHVPPSRPFQAFPFINTMLYSATPSIRTPVKWPNTASSANVATARFGSTPTVKKSADSPKVTVPSKAPTQFTSFPSPLYLRATRSVICALSPRTDQRKTSHIAFVGPAAAIKSITRLMSAQKQPTSPLPNCFSTVSYPHPAQIHVH